MHLQLDWHDVHDVRQFVDQLLDATKYCPLPNHRVICRLANFLHLNANPFYLSSTQTESTEWHVHDFVSDQFDFPVNDQLIKKFCFTKNFRFCLPFVKFHILEFILNGMKNQKMEIIN